MLQKEFEERVRMNVTPTQYGIIETLYNDSDLDKDVFCAKWKENDRMEMSELNANTISTLHNRIFAKDAEIKKKISAIEETAYFLIDKADEIEDIDLHISLYKKAVELIGRKKAVIHKIKNDYRLTDTDKNFIMTELI